MLFRKQYALVKIEAEPGVDARPTGANRIAAVNEFQPAPYEGNTVTRNRLRPHLGGYAEINVAPYSTLSIQVPLAGSGTPGTAPSFAALLRACGLSQTDGSGIVYQPVSENFETCSIYFILDGQLHKITNAIGSPTFDFSTGAFPTVTFAMMGVYNHPVAAAALSGSPAVQADELPVNSRNTVIDVFDYGACGQSYSLNVNNTTTHRDLIGCEHFIIQDRDSSGQVQIDAPDLATKDYFDAVESHEQSTTGAINLVHGKTAGNIVTLNQPRAQLSTISVSDQDGTAQYAMNHKALPIDGDDEFTLEFA